MNGPDHYREAQKLAAHVDERNNHPAGDDTAAITAMGIAALTHAVLALTAATADTQTLAGRAIWQETTR